MRGMPFDDTDSPPELRRLEGEYEFLRELGRGGMAVVYLARDRQSGHMVAVKVIDRRYLEDPDAASRFAREARTAAALNHPNIVRLLAVKQVGERTLAIVRQYVAGGTLRDALAGGPFSYGRAARVMLDVAEALRYAHERGIVHRDVKPENIFLDESTGGALLSDFGIARLVTGDSRVTVTGGTIGTPAYMSPEQIEGKAVDGRSDLYSLGLVGWEMLAGKRPWEGEGVYSVIYKQIHEELPRLTTLRTDIPESLLFAIEGALHKHPDTRWADADELIAELSVAGPAARPAARTVVEADGGDLPTVRFRRPVDGWPGEPAPRAAPAVEAVGAPADVGAPEVNLPALEPPRRSRARTALLIAVPVLAVLVAFAMASEGRTSRADRARRAGAADSLTTVARGGAVGPESADRRTPAARPPAATPPAMLDTASGRGSGAGRAADSAPAARRAPATPGVATTRPAAPAASPPASPPAAGTRSAPAAPARAAIARTRADSLRLCQSPAAADQRACLFAHLTESDAELNRVYRAVIAEMRQMDRVAAGAPDPDAVRRLRAEQRAWIERRDAECRRRTRGREGALWAPVRARCFAEISDARAKELSQTLAVLRRMRRP